MTRSLLFLYGNCQMGRFAQGFGRHPDAPRLFDVRKVPSFSAFGEDAKPSHKALIQDFENNASDCRVFIYQSEAWDKNSALITDLLPADCIRIPIISLALSTAWPFYFKDMAIRKGRSETAADYFPYGDTFITRRVKAGASLDEVVREYTTLDVNSVLSLDEWKASNLAMLRKREESSSIRISSYIEETFEAKRCFWAPNHPTNSLVRHAFGQVLEVLGLDDLDAKAGDDFASHIGLGALPQLPVHPSIIEHFGLTYIDNNSLYTHQEQSMDFESWVRLYTATAINTYRNLNVSAV